MVRTRSTPPDAPDCVCSVCSVSRLKGQNATNHNAKMAEPPGRPRAEDRPEEEEKGPITVCESCLGPYQKGKPHHCSLRAREANLQNLVKNSVASVRQRLVVSELREQVQQSSPSSSHLGHRAVAVELQAGNQKKVAVQVGTSRIRPKADKIENEAFDGLQLTGGFSDYQMREVAHFVRVHFGRTAVVKHQNHVVERNARLSDYFTHSIIEQTIYVNVEEDSAEEAGGRAGGKHKRTTKRVMKKIAHVRNFPEFVSQVVQHRNLDRENLLIQVGIDHGGDWLKIMCSIKEKEPTKNHEQVSKRRSYEEGYKPKNFMFSGVKKMLTLALLKSPERHDNMESILQLIDIGTVQFALSCDLKMVLFIIGKSAASSTFACPFCNDSKPDWSDPNPTPLTIQQLWDDYNAYQLAVEEAQRKGNKTLPDGKRFHNTVNKPLCTGPGDQKILGETVLFPELHVMTGVVSKLIKEAQSLLFETPEEGAAFFDTWFEEPGINIQRTVYHGQASFIGNMAQKILKKVDSLEAKLTPALAGTDKAELGQLFMKALRQFGIVVNNCFGQSLDPLFEDSIKEFMTTYRSLGVSLPLKIHILERHCAEFLYQFGNGQQGLGYFSEQVQLMLY